MKQIFIAFGLVLVFSSCSSIVDDRKEDFLEQKEAAEQKFEDQNAQREKEFNRYSDSVDKAFDERVERVLDVYDSTTVEGERILNNVLKGKDEVPKLDELEQIEKDLLLK